ncbi:hyphally regulated cell wall protein, partial [Scheffersomyces stipitis CBS 6054]
MLFRKYILAVLTLITSVMARTITTNTIDRGAISLGLGDTIIEDGVYWSIIDNLATAFAGNVDVGSGSGLYISGLNPLLSMSVTLLSGSLTNDGIISLNAVQSLLAPTYSLVGISFTNNGEMYLGADGSFGSPNIQITAPIWNNNGLLVFYQKTRSSASIELGTSGLDIKNNGQICFFNELYTQRTNIVGTGCITLDENSSIFLSNTLLNIDTNQVFYLADSASSIQVHAISFSKTYNVAGFGNGNKIGLDVTLVNLPPLLNGYTYDTKTGILTLRGGGVLSPMNFNIGLGYNPSLFKIVTDDNTGIIRIPAGAVTYSGPPPNSVPSVCQPCKKLPPAPGTSATEFTTTATSTNSDGFTCTEVDDIIVSTDKSNSWFTSTSTITAGCISNPTNTITST